MLAKLQTQNSRRCYQLFQSQLPSFLFSPSQGHHGSSSTSFARQLNRPLPFKDLLQGAGEMAQWLRALAVLAEDSALTWFLPTSFNSSSRKIQNLLVSRCLY